MIGENTPMTSVVSGDFDDDGDVDFVAACRELSRIEIYAGNGIGGHSKVLEVDVPSAAYVAAGDIDGDGLIDFVGTGSVLWTALSGATPPPAPISEVVRPKVTGILINELLPKNDSIGIAEDGMKNSDAIEIYNATFAAVDLEGWKLSLVTAGGETREYVVPSAVVMGAGGRQVFVCRKGNSVLHTGYKLPAEGGALQLIDPAGAVVEISMARTHRC
ncbi:MAG: hypothetical protein ACI8XO_001069 [Verrucomicrobiales bacterium]